MDLTTGNSGNHLLKAVVKIGAGCQQEGAFCQHLGGDVTPVIYAVIPDGYVMEALEPAPRHPELLRLIEAVLMKKVWNRPALPITNDIGWRAAIEKYGVKVPDWLDATEPCLVHGDPTASNALLRQYDVILCDPRPPREFIPQSRETDMGRILQSYYGWEVAAYGAYDTIFKRPHFVDDPIYAPRAMFWCGAAAARIEYLERSRESRPNILHWCKQVRELCHV